ncbi:MAG: response regulator [Lactobacillales bacterium]|jgi:DNA-binding response OmpR family regulator|nr:response regulator [Lactobacillales bacterium]
MEKWKIFIVEDDPKIVTLLTQALENWQFIVKSVNNFYHVASEILEEDPNLILMDVNLPCFNGFHWTQEVRKLSVTPIIFLSSREDKMSKIMAMNLGADDFIEKPFDLEVLVVKIQSVLRRTYMFSKNQEGLKFKEYELDLEASKVCFNEESVQLSKNELRILRMLV